jgi:hypothetical protein
MKIASLSTGHCAAGLIAIAAIVAGCTSATPTGVGIPSAAHSRGVRHLVLETTTVKFYNSGSSTIYGSGSATCWSVSPTPLPSIGPGNYSGVIDLSYDTACVGGPDHIDISYGPSGGPSCLFTTTYNAGFSYSVSNNPLTDCTATASGAPIFKELFSYDPSGSLNKRHR